MGSADRFEERSKGKPPLVEPLQDAIKSQMSDAEASDPETPLVADAPAPDLESRSADIAPPEPLNSLADRLKKALETPVSPDSPRNGGGLKPLEKDFLDELGKKPAEDFYKPLDSKPEIPPALEKSTTKLSVHDVLVTKGHDGKSGDRIAVLERIDDTEGVRYRVERTTADGKVLEPYELSQDLVDISIRGGVFEAVHTSASEAPGATVRGEFAPPATDKPTEAPPGTVRKRERVSEPRNFEAGTAFIQQASKGTKGDVIVVLGPSDTADGHYRIKRSSGMSKDTAELVMDGKALEEELTKGRFRPIHVRTQAPVIATSDKETTPVVPSSGGEGSSSPEKLKKMTKAQIKTERDAERMRYGKKLLADGNEGLVTTEHPDQVELKKERVHAESLKTAKRTEVPVPPGAQPEDTAHETAMTISKSLIEQGLLKALDGYVGGESVSVIRSTGEKEDDWRYIGTDPKGSFVAVVKYLPKEGRLNKSIPIEEFKRLNPRGTAPLTQEKPKTDATPEPPLEAVHDNIRDVLVISQAIAAEKPSAPEQTAETIAERLKNLKEWDILLFKDGEKSHVMATGELNVVLIHRNASGEEMSINISWQDLQSRADDIERIEAGTEEDYTPATVSETPPSVGQEPPVIESSEPPTPEETPKPEGTAEKKEEPLHTAERFAKGFGEFNISQEDLKKLEGYENLSEGKRALLLENFRQLTLGTVEREAAEKTAAKSAKAGLVERIVRAFGKKYIVAKEQKGAYEAARAAGIGRHEAMLKALVDVLSKSNEVVVRGNALETQYFDDAGFDADQKQSVSIVIEHFNNAASSFARLPIHWSYDSASKDHRKQFAAAQKAFETAKADMLVLRSTIKGESEAMLDMNAAETAVRTNQYFNEHPDVEQELQRIKDDSAFVEGFGKIGAERTAYMVAGGVGRWAAAGALGVFAAPAVAAVSGGTMAWRRGKESLKERDRQATGGVTDTSAQALNMAPARRTITNEVMKPKVGKPKELEITKTERTAGLLDKLERNIKALEQGGNPSADASQLQKLMTRLDYTEKKLADGLIDFGSGTDRIYNQYRLIETVAAGRALLETRASGGDGSPLEPYSKVGRRLESFLGTKAESIRKNRRSYLLKQTAYGAAIGAGAAYAGRKIFELISAPKTGGIQPEHAPSPGPDRPPLMREHVPTADELSRTGTRKAADEILTHAEVREPDVAVAASMKTVVGGGERAVPMEVAGQAAVQEAGGQAGQTAETAVHQAAEAAATRSVGVEVHQGESMIKAFGRTLEEQYGVEHDRATDIANRVWAEDSKNWYNVVHEGDKFNIDLRGVDAEALKTGDLGQLSEKIAFNDASYSFEKSGIAPEFRAPSVAEATPTPEVPACTLAEAIAGTKHQISPEAYAFLGKHRAVFDPASNELSYDLNDDGVFTPGDASAKAEVFKLGSHIPNGVDHVSMQVNPSNGNLVVEAWSADGNTKELFELTPGGLVEGGRLEQLAHTVAEQVTPQVEAYVVEGRFGQKIVRTADEYARVSKAMEARYPGILKFLGVQKADLLVKDTRGLVKLLHERFDVPKSDAKKIAKPLHYIFEAFHKGKINFTDSDTIERVVSRIELKR